MQITKHFSFERCRCACCDLLMHTPRLYTHMMRLEVMRQKLDFPMIITSGYRCPEHNEEVGGKPYSQHLIYATDVRPLWGKGFAKRVLAIYRVALIQSWGGIGYYKSFIHLDLRPEEARWRGRAKEAP